MKPTKQFKGLINYKPSSNTRMGDNIDSSATSSNDDKQRIEFVHHKLTSLLLRIGDMVLIIVPEEFEILQTLDPMLHGKVGTIVSLDSFDEDECEDLIQVEIENKKTNHIDHTITTQRQSEVVSVPKFCVCLKAEIFNERKERYLSQRRARSYDSLSTSSSISSDISQSLTSMLSSTCSLSPECLPSSNGRNLSSLLGSPSKHSSSPPTTTNITNSCSPKYSLGPKKTASLLTRQKRFHSSATVPPPLLSSTSTFFQSSTTTQVVGNNKKPLSSPSKTSKKNSYQISTNSQFSSKHYTDNDVDMTDNFLSQSVPKYINSFMLSDFESSNIFSADIPTENVNRHRLFQDTNMKESTTERVS